MGHDITALSPSSVWTYFARIAAIPHGSGNEAALARAVGQWAAQAGCEADTDDAGNVRICIPPSKGLASAPGVILQAHLDMVCEKNADTVFNFEKDPIALRIDGGWVTAEGTTLGADNGIGLAMGLALMGDRSTPHGPLEVLCTMSEETGLNGALGLRKNWLQGTVLINTDTEKEGEFIIGCAGGVHTDLTLEVEREPGLQAVQLAVAATGLPGGHSGMDIHLNRGNAIRMLAQALRAVCDAVPIRICAFEGGDKHNAIPREARAVICAAAGDIPAVRQVLAAQQEELRAALPAGDNGFRLDTAPHQSTVPPLDPPSSLRLLQLLLALPHGVLAMSRELPGMVESSTNVANARLRHNLFSVLTSHRSSNPAALRGIAVRARAIGELAGAQISENTGYPPWQPDPSSPVLQPASSLYEEMFGKQPMVTTVHAGLEGGIIKEHYPHLDILSLGPDIEHPHSPFERVRIESVARVYDYLCRLLTRLAEQG